MTYLFGRWLHSHEEDTPEATVYRRDSFPFPPSRGRHGFELRDDGSLVDLGPGAADRPGHSAGAWEQPEPGQLKLCGGFGERCLQIIALSEDKLTVSKG
ncbi:MAG: hypothetical protein IT168_00930 [Bryobacterales bacterium]|nr:hypothetical protein [Bryobacterales bacterium]